MHLWFQKYTSLRKENCVDLHMYSDFLTSKELGKGNI